MYTQFIKKLIDLPDFTIVSCHELENGWVFQLQPSKQCPICPVCFGKTQRHAVIHRRLRHTFSWNTGTIWIDVPFYRQRCTTCPLTFTFDYGLEASRIATKAYQMQIVEACHARTISEVAREYQLAYITVERWFYELALTQLIEESPTRIVWMSLRFVKDILMRQVF